MGSKASALGPNLCSCSPVAPRNAFPRPKVWDLKRRRMGSCGHFGFGVVRRVRRKVSPPQIAGFKHMPGRFVSRERITVSMTVTESHSLRRHPAVEFRVHTPLCGRDQERRSRLSVSRTAANRRPFRRPSRRNDLTSTIDLTVQQRQWQTVTLGGTWRH